MSDPSYDDDWAELARELERNAPPSPKRAEATRSVKDTPAAEDTAGADTPRVVLPEPAPEAAAGEPLGDQPEAEAPVTAEAPDAAEADGGEESAPDGDGDGVPGTGRKRRRRRRRRRKGSAAGAAEPETGTAPTDAPEPEAGDDLSAVEYPGEQDGGPDRDESDRNGDEREAGEDAGGDLLRELIANWNVPSWDEIVSGLYRPDR